MKFNKKGVGQIGAIVGGVIGLIFLIVVGFVSVDLLTSSGLLTADSAFDNASDSMVGNLTSGVNQVSSKIPTIFTIAVAVLLLGLIVFLAVRARQIQQTQGASL
jgi:hypothetical protein